MGMLSMVEIGNTAGIAYAGPVIGAKNGQIPNSTKAAASGKVAYDDRAAAVIQNAFRLELSQFVTEQFPDSKQIFREAQASLNSSKFSMVKLQQEFIETLRAQANVEPSRAFQLLKPFTV
jgi:hypothetical protein